jgi:hypothetical protein
MKWVAAAIATLFAATQVAAPCAQTFGDYMHSLEPYWLNPFTNITVQLPPGWWFSDDIRVGSEHNRAYMFSSEAASAMLIVDDNALAADYFNAPFDVHSPLLDYAPFAADFLGAAVGLEANEFIEAENGVTAEGKIYAGQEDIEHPAKVTVAKNGTTFWTLIVSDLRAASPADIPDQDISAVLWQSAGFPVRL